MALALVSVASGAGFGQEDDVEEERPRGMIAVYASRQFPQETATRVERMIAFDWGVRPPDPRLSAGPFSAQWRGYVLTQAPGEYRLAAHGAGTVTITLAGERILEATADSPQWSDARPIELPYGWHPLEITYASGGESPRLALFWSGPQFAWEPLNERQLYHEPVRSPTEAFAHGESLAAALRCLACHVSEHQPKPSPAPALNQLAGNISRPWLVEWLMDDGGLPTAEEERNDAPVGGSSEGSLRSNATASARRMPHFGFSRDEAVAIAAYLLNASEPPRGEPRRGEPPRPRSRNKPAARKKSNQEPKKDQEQEPQPPSAVAGERLGLTLGCVACHRVGELGESGWFGGGDLTRIAEKRPAEFFRRWLADPASVNRDHRMPVFELSDDERESLALYLATLGEERAAPRETASEDRELVHEGRRLVEANRCGACHALPGNAARPAPVAAISTKTRWDRSCTGEPHSGKQPGYRLAPEDAAAIREYFAALSRVSQPASAAIGARLVLRERNCFACHERDDSPGLRLSLANVIAAHADLAPLLPAMTPPPLASVGDKLHEQALADAIRRTSVHRPYLAVRMPKFELTGEELHALVTHFVAQDRIPSRPERPSETPEPTPEFEAAGARLVTTDGFGCVSCHQIGAVQPEKAPLNARGPDLALLSRRIRQEWFDRWTRNPARIAPRMEMPAVQLPVRGVLNDNLDRQLAAVWHALNTPGFEPPPPNPVRVLRRAGLRERNEWALIGTDVLYDRGREYVKPFVIGLPNRHNVLFDLEKNRLAGWWLGDTAYQRTKGKTWYWESGGGPHAHLISEPIAGSELTIEIDGERREPLVTGQFPTEVDEWRHVNSGVQWRQRLRFAGKSEGEPPQVVHVEQTITPIWPSEDSPESGFRRSVVVRGVPENARAVFHRGTEGDAEIRSSPDRHRVASFEWEYLTPRLPDTFPVEPPQFPAPAPTPLAVAPGFDAVQLPLPETIMPTALTWTPEGTLAIASLKGEVWLAHDTDGDGLEDRAAQFSDDLAAPYGLASRSRLPDGTVSDVAGEKASGGRKPPDEAALVADSIWGLTSPARQGLTVDVINKYALLRLFDDDGDGRAERTVTLASGWGHTTDYHDWAVGLPRDETGAYYVALPCQQDDRSPEAAHLRGCLLRLMTREPTDDDPRRFAVEVVTAGHRFPMGIARRRDGELFVTDNQGNYNPFNELNHIVPGRRYGFINKLEQKQGINPPLTAPAIDLPHPWTRSVNGICFLYTPPTVREKLGRDAFGPFEGHLIGCEMNNRTLVRMTLHRVGDVIQGAVYPLTYKQPKEGLPLLGPLCAEVSPAGDLYVGSLLDSGWGGGNNIGSVVRMRPAPDRLPSGIREVRAEPRGLIIEFTRPVDGPRAADVTNYSLSSYTRTSTPAYGGDDQLRRTEKISQVEVASDGLSALLALNEWREGFVYELHLENLAGEGHEFFPAEAYYTLRQAP